MPEHTTLRFVGLDVHKRQITACFVDAEGQKLHTRTFVLTRARLAHFAQHVLRPTDQVALEATTNCWAVARVLQEHVARVVVSNPMVTKAIAKAKVKTDKVDAHVLAQLLRCDFLPEVWHPDTTTQQTARTDRPPHGAGAAADRAAQSHPQRAGRAADRNARDLVQPRRPSLVDRTAAVARRARTAADALRTCDLLQAVQQEIDALEQQLARARLAGPAGPALDDVARRGRDHGRSRPGRLGDIKRFRTPDQAAAYLGLVPSTHQSADKCYHGPITKRGNNQARWMLIEAAQHLRQHPGPLGPLLSPPEAAEEPQRGGGGHGAQAGDDRLAHAPQERALSVRDATLHRTEAGQSARAGHRARSRKAARRKGSQVTAKLPGGSRTIKSLDRVYAQRRTCRLDNP